MKYYRYVRRSFGYAWRNAKFEGYGPGAVIVYFAGYIILLPALMCMPSYHREVSEWWRSTK